MTDGPIYDPVDQHPDLDAWFRFYAGKAKLMAPLQTITYVAARAVLVMEMIWAEGWDMPREMALGALFYECQQQMIAPLTRPRFWVYRDIPAIGPYQVYLLAASLTVPMVEL